MTYDTLGTVVVAGADRAEEVLPKLTYRQVLENLGTFADLGLWSEGSLSLMLVVARLVDRRRILQSGLTSADMEQVLEQYRRGCHGDRVQVIENALAQALRTLRQAEALKAAGLSALKP